MKCPYSDVIICAELETADIPESVACETCKHYKPILQSPEKLTVEELMDKLPTTLVRDKRTIFHLKDVFDLHITRDASKDWLIKYINHSNNIVFYSCTDSNLHKCLVKMVTFLIQNKYILL